MTLDPFETNRLLTEAEDKRGEAARARIRDNDVERVKDMLMRLPLLKSGQHQISDAAWKICFAIELAREELVEQQELLPEWRANIRRDARKPIAGAATDAFADWYWTLTGKAVTRVSKDVDGRLGLQETGEFAKFLGEVFEVFGIQASTAGQVKTWKNRVDPAELKQQVHPDDFARIIQAMTRELESGDPSREAIDRLLRELRPGDE